jgi:hypothetical protein
MVGMLKKADISRFLLILTGFIFGVISSLPWPWGLRKIYARSISRVRHFGISRHQGIIRYAEGIDEEFRMGKTSGVNISISNLGDLIQALEDKKVPAEKLAPLIEAVKGLDFQEMKDDELNATVEHLIDVSRHLL